MPDRRPEPPRVLTTHRGRFYRGERPHQIISGAIHYFRIHPDLWRDRLERLRAMGLNTVETYVPWNFHEREPGRTDFTGWRDLTRFVRLAEDCGLDVIVRPGPYICAEWDFGGLPAWLMRSPGMALRCADPAYLSAVRDWLAQVCAQLRPLLATREGPVVAVQVENEYGSYGDDLTYRRFCRDELVRGGVDVLLLTSDGPDVDSLGAGMVDGAHATANFGSDAKIAFEQLRTAQPSGPDMCMEFWNGWFDHWGEPHHVRPAEDAAGVLDDILSLDASVNIYMAHGGTNFGLWNGCNVEGGLLQPTITSYDYDAPVGEAGEITEKFTAYREVITRHTGETPPEAPPLPARQGAQEVVVEQWNALLDSGIDECASHAAVPLSMEDLGQSHGLVLYRATTRIPRAGGILRLDGLADRATVLVDGAVVGVIDRNDRSPELAVAGRADGGPSELVLIVENQGRINFAGGIGERKGVRTVRIGHRQVHGWDSHALRLDDLHLTHRLTFGDRPDSSGPVFGRTELMLEDPADGFLALPGWTKGFVWLNGFLLGRYWNIGPQTTLYAPRPLWRPGANEVIVLEMERPGDRIQVRPEPDLTGLRATSPGMPAAADIV